MHYAIGVDEEEYNINHRNNNLLDSNIVFGPNESKGYREEYFHIGKVQSLSCFPRILRKWDCLIF